MLHPTGTACLRDLRNVVYDPSWEYGCGCRKGVRVSTEQNTDLAREAIRVWTTGDLDEIYAPDYVNHQHHDPGVPRDLHGTEAMKLFAHEFREAFPDFHDSVDIRLAEGDAVATRFMSRGTHRDTFMGVEPADK